MAGIIAFENLSSSCWINSVLQFMTPVVDLWKKISAEKIELAKWRYDKDLLEFLRTLQTSKWDENKRQLYTERFVHHHLSKLLATRFNLSEQQDVHEFVMLILDRVATNDMRFKGSMTRSTRCQSGHISAISNDFYQLHIEDVNQVSNLAEFIDKQFSEAELQGTNQYQCDQCNGKTNATTFVDVDHWPSFLIIQVGRFDFASGQKNNTKFRFPTLWRGFKKDGTSFRYKLMTMIIHQGSTMCHGHYVAYGRVPQNDGLPDRWNLYNDESVFPVTLEDVQSHQCQKNVYLLMYQMADE